MSPACVYHPHLLQTPEAKNVKEMEKLTAIVEPVQFPEIVIAEVHSLSYYIHEFWDVGDDGGLSSVPEGIFAVVQHGSVVIGNIQEV